MNAQYLLSVHLVYLGVIIMAILGVVANLCLVKLERRLSAWKEG
jgi:NitT/TauT family transport system permease protein